MIGILALIFAGLAALLHVYIFVLESVRWTQPKTWKVFGIADQQTADATRPMAYNQGFYNLFLAVGAAVGIVFWIVNGIGDVAGRTLLIFSLGSMLAAALVLVTSGAKYLRPASIQGTLPLIGLILAIFA
ncbi:epimerase [Rhodococcus sp. 06-1477-1B]|nr:epimerase [Rhodococcus sp. 06-1477-1B]